LEVELNFTKAVLSCSQPVAQAHERLPITNDSLPCSWPIGRAQLRSCHQASDGVPCPLVMRVSQRVESTAVLTIRRVACR